MKLKGKTTIELKDVKTGEVTVVKDTNFFTNAYHDLCQPILRTHAPLHKSWSHYTRQLSANELLGGILLFDSNLGEDANNYFPPITANMTGHGSEITYSGADLTLGSFNDTLSDVSSANERTYVWDFTAEQANGEIASVCLTTRQGGLIGHGTKTPCEINSAFQRFFGCLQRIRGTVHFPNSMAYVLPIYLSFKDDYILELVTSDTTSGILNFKKAPFWSNKEDIFMNGDSLSSITFYSDIEIGAGHTEFLEFQVDLTNEIGSSGYIGHAQDGKYLYIARNTNNASSYSWAVNTEIKVVKLNLEDFSYEALKVTNTTGEAIKLFERYDNYAFQYGYNFAVSNGYMFVSSAGTYNEKGARVYAINLDDNTIVHKIKTADGDENLTWGVSNTDATHCFGITVNNNVMFTDARQFNVPANAGSYTPVKCVNTDDFICKSLGTPWWGMVASYIASSGSDTERAFPSDNPLYYGTNSMQNIHTSSSTRIFKVHMVPNMLMTINNLDTPIIKTPSQTMRLTYTITKEE